MKKWRLSEFTEGWFIVETEATGSDQEAIRAAVEEAEAGDAEAIAALLLCQESDPLVREMLKEGK